MKVPYKPTILFTKCASNLYTDIPYTGAFKLAILFTADVSSMYPSIVYIGAVQAQKNLASTQ